MHKLLITKEDELRLTVQNALSDPDCFDLMGHILAMTGLFNRGVCSERESGVKDFGLTLRDLIISHDFESWIKFETKAKE